VQAELVRRALASLRPEARDFGMEDVERILNALTPGAGRRRASIGNGLEVERFGLEAILHAEGAAATFPQYPQMASPRPRHVRPPTTVRLAHGWRFVAQETRLTARIRRELMGNTDPHVAAFDPEALAGPLTLRPPEPGDRLRPLGLKGSVKVAELLVDRHIPRPARALWPILVAGAAPVWVAGLRMDREARLRLLGQLARVGAKSDMILIDTPAGIGQDVIGLAIAAESVLVVATPEPTSITDAYALIKVIWQESSNANFQVLVNQASSEVTARAASEQLTTVARRFLKIDVPTLGYLPVDPNVPKSIRRQETVITAFPNSPAARGFMAIADRLMEDGVAAERHSRVFGFVRRLARRGERAAAF